jgi:hypothetical protein
MANPSGTNPVVAEITVGGALISTGSGVPTFSASKGSLYINTSGTATTARLFINTTGATAWAYFTASA